VSELGGFFAFAEGQHELAPAGETGANPVLTRFSYDIIPQSLLDGGFFEVTLTVPQIQATAQSPSGSAPGTLAFDIIQIQTIPEMSVPLLSLALALPGLWVRRRV
jgi:hypothetical protein